MPLLIDGSLQIGPRGAASITTVPEYLASISKNSWYIGYVAGSGMASNSDGSGTVSDGGAVGKWSPIYYTSGLDTVAFTQATSGNRPAYGASRNGLPGIYGDASAWHMNLNSTTQLNGSYTVLIKAWTVLETAHVYSHNSNGVAWSTATTTQDQFIVNSVQTQVSKSVFYTPVPSTTQVANVGWSTTGTAHNGFAPRILMRTSGTAPSSSTIHTLWLVPVLTASEIRGALAFL